MKFYASAVFLTLFALAGSAAEVFACTCGAPGTVLEETARSPIVVSARLDQMEELDRVVEGANVYRTFAAVMTVEKAYKGRMRPGQTIRILDGGGGDCTKAFVRERPGQKFLLYMGPAMRIGKLPGVLHSVSSCSRSTRLEEAAADLIYLDNRAKLAGQTRISGVIKRFSPEPASLVGIQVTISGKSAERTVETDERGFFEAWGLPAGQYQVAFKLPGGVRVTAYRLAPGDRAWRREIPPDNTIRTPLAARKHVELTVGIDRQNSAVR